MYEPPKSELIDIEPECGCCPSCGKRIGLWVAAKPTFKMNRFACNHCGENIKYLFPQWFFILMNIVGIGSILLVVWITMSIKSAFYLFNNTFLILGLYFFLMSLSYLLVGSIEALCSRKNFRLAVVGKC